MDGKRFDAVTRRISMRPSRRALLSVLSGAALGACLSALGGSDADARKKSAGNNKKKCRKLDRDCGSKQKCCKGLACTNGTCLKPRAPECDNDNDCGGIESCQNGQCVAACVPACSGDRDCDGGQCVCPSARPHSGGFCDDTCRECCIDDHCGQFNGKKCDHSQGSVCVCANSFNHDCGQLCQTCCIQEHCIPIIGDQSECVDGGCRCHAGLTICFDGVSGQNTCVDLHTAQGHCGECGHDCPQGTQCIDAACT